MVSRSLEGKRGIVWGSVYTYDDDDVARRASALRCYTRGASSPELVLEKPNILIRDMLDVQPRPRYIL